MPNQLDKAVDKWKGISKNIKLSENIIRKNQLKVYWPFIIQYQKLSVPFIREFISTIIQEDLWTLLSSYQTLDQDFILEYRDSLNWDEILRYQEVTTRFIPQYSAEITAATDNGGNITVSTPKTNIKSTITELNTFTTIDVEASTTPANNTSYTLTSVSEDDTNWIFAFTDTFDEVAVRIGWLSLPESGNTNTTTFIEDPLIVPYLHKNNNVAKVFRDNLSTQSLSFDYITTNIADLNIKILSQYQNLTDLYIAQHDVDSNIADALNDITFDFEQLTISHDFNQLLLEPDYTSWIKAKLNFQLLLRYQNLTRDFILSNLDSLQIADIGRYNKNLSEADLDQLAIDFPSLSESTSRPPSVRFDYIRGDIINDLEAAGFISESGDPVGYVFYNRNGMVQTKPSLNFNVPSESFIDVSQVDLNEDNPIARTGITVLNGNDLIKHEDRQRFKIAKVSVPINPRDIDNPSSGSISFKSKSIYTETDKFTISDGISLRLFEFDLDNNFMRSNSEVYNITTFNSLDSVLTTTEPHRHSTGDPIIAQNTLASPLINGNTYYVIKLSDTEMRLSIDLESALSNQSLTIANAGGELRRIDNAFNTFEDLTMYTGQPIQFIPFGIGGIAPLSPSTVYYVIKVDSFTFQVALTLNEALRGDNVVIIDDTQNVYDVFSDSIPINIRPDSIINSTDVASVYDKVINDLYEVEIAFGFNTIDFEQDPFYTDLRDGSVSSTTEFIDYSTTFTANADNNQLSLVSNILLDNGDPINFIGGSLPAPLSAGVIYYVIKITDTTILLAVDPEDAEFRISIDLTASGSGTLHANRVDLATDISLQTGNRIEISSVSLPAPLSAGVIYYVNRINSKKIEFCSTQVNAFDGIPIIIQKTGSDANTVTADDYNAFDGGSKTAIVHFKTDQHLYIEPVNGTFIVGDTIELRGGSAPQNIASVNKILDITSVQNINTLALTNDIASGIRSDGNVPMTSYTAGINAITHNGMTGGYEDTILDKNAKGVGCIIDELGTLRAFSVKIIDNDYFDELRF